MNTKKIRTKMNHMYITELSQPEPDRTIAHILHEELMIRTREKLNKIKHLIRQA